MTHQLAYFWPFIRLGLTDVWRHKTRSFLTMLGVVFGVGSVIAMLAVGEGASQQALESIRRLGSQNIMVMSVKPTSEESGSTGAQHGRLAVYGLFYEDQARICETIPGVSLTVPARMTRRIARLGERQLELRVVETQPSWFDVVQRPVLAGRVLTENDLLMRANVCVLTEHGVRRLLAAEGNVGQRIRISSGIFEVIGVVRNDTGGTVRAPDSEADAYIR
jgi:putative ABC transport system permease protein